MLNLNTFVTFYFASDKVHVQNISAPPSKYRPCDVISMDPDQPTQADLDPCHMFEGHFLFRENLYIYNNCISLLHFF